MPLLSDAVLKRGLLDVGGAKYGLKDLAAGGGGVGDIAPNGVNTWEAMADSPAPWAYHASVERNGLVHMMGGIGAGSTGLVQHYVLDPSDGSWTQLANIPIGRQRGFAIVLPDGRIMLTGGNTSTSGSTTTYIYDPDTDTWETGPSMGTARRDHNVIRTSDDLIVACWGYTGGTGGTFTATAEAFDGTSWTAIAQPGADVGISTDGAKTAVPSFEGRGLFFMHQQYLREYTDAGGWSTVHTFVPMLDKSGHLASPGLEAVYYVNYDTPVTKITIPEDVRTTHGQPNPLPAPGNLSQQSWLSVGDYIYLMGIDNNLTKVWRFAH